MKCGSFHPLKFTATSETACGDSENVLTEGEQIKTDPFGSGSQLQQEFLQVNFTSSRNADRLFYFPHHVYSSGHIRMICCSGLKSEESWN